MRKLVVLFLLGSTVMLAQEEVVKSVEKVAKTLEDTTVVQGWTKKGNFNFLANQSTFTNWLPGGQSNFAIATGINYDFNYKRGVWSWDNKLMVNYGVTKIKGQDLLKSDDRIEFNSLAGRKASGYWYYSMFLNFRSQLTTDLGNPAPGFALPKTTSFFSPAYLQVGPGMMWRKRDTFKFNIAPLTSRFIFVMDKELSDVGAFGVDPGKNLRFEFGASLSGYYKFDLWENVSMENILNLYTNYLEDPQNVDLDYQVNIVMKINKYLSTNLAFQAIYDDNAFKGFQTRQVIGVGVNVGF
ncbi:MAG: DUF3078 domain-containing protein [Flavobacterium sp.]